MPKNKSRVDDTMELSDEMLRRGRLSAQWIISTDAGAFVIVLGIATIILLPALIHGFPTGDDAIRQYRWANGFFVGLSEGAFYPRWLAGANYGLGSPIFIYYPPLLFYVEAGLRAIVRNQVVALLLGSWLGMVLSGLTMHLFSKTSPSRGAGIFAAILYMTIPAHVFEFYQLSALAEFWCFAWVPLLFETTRRTVDGASWRAVPYLGLSYSLLILTHVPSSLIVTLILPIYALVLTRNLTKLIRVAAGIALGAGLSGIFVLPFLLETKYIRTEIVLSHFDYRDFFAFEHIMAAFKHPLFINDQSAGAYVLENEPVVLGLALLLVVPSLIMLDRRRAANVKGRLLQMLAVCAVAVVSLLMTTRISDPVWRSVPQLASLPFPGRWQVIASAGVCFLATEACFAAARDRKRRALHLTGIAAAVIFNLWVTDLSIKRAPHDPEGIDPGPLFKEERFYNPIWLDRSATYGFEDGAPATVTEGDAAVLDVSASTSKQTYSVIAKAQTVLRLRTAYFPGWTARVDGEVSQIEPSKEGNIQLRLPPGEHKLQLDFEDTAPRAAGKAVSGTALFVLLVMFYRSSHLRRWSRAPSTTRGRQPSN